jgi:hypothetical protein
MEKPDDGCFPYPVRRKGWYGDVFAKTMVLDAGAGVLRWLAVWCSDGQLFAEFFQAAGARTRPGC